MQRNKDFHKLFSNCGQAHTNCSIQNLLFLGTDHNQLINFQVSNLYDKSQASVYSLYLKLALENICMLVFLLIFSFIQWDQKALHLKRIPWLNINHFLFQLFHIFIPHSDDEAVLIFLFLCLFVLHLFYLLFSIFQEL